MSPKAILTFPNLIVDLFVFELCDGTSYIPMQKAKFCLCKDVLGNKIVLLQVSTDHQGSWWSVASLKWKRNLQFMTANYE